MLPLVMKTSDAIQKNMISTTSVISGATIRALRADQRSTGFPPCDPGGPGAVIAPALIPFLPKLPRRTQLI
jgi:hypothetical protein